MDYTKDNSIKIPFKVSARTAKLIGLENFSNEEGAIIELVKNTYDADAKNCILIFDLKYVTVKTKEGEEIKVVDKHNSKIYIIDNGIGMNDEIISEQWMTLGTDNKLYKHTSDDGRIKTGAKGIGRFALNRLGLFTNMYTLPKESQEGFQWLVDWRDFDKKGATVSDVEAVLTKIENLNLKEELLGTFNDSQKITDLIINTQFDSGTIIEISEINDSWGDEQLQKLFGNLEILLPPREQADFAIDFLTTANNEGYGKVKTAYYDDYDYKVEAYYNEENKGNLKINVTRNELDIRKLEDEYAEVFDYPIMNSFPYRLEDFKEKTITIVDKHITEILSNHVDKDLIAKIGKFDFTFYFLKNTISDDKADGNKQKYPYKNFDSSNRKSWLKRFGGVKIFRDDFRVRPYGENGEDWLKLGEEQSKSPGGAGQRLGGYRIRPNQIAGTIRISRIHNLSFQDKSGREGIIENDVFELFKNLIKAIISSFEKDRNTIMFYLSELGKKRNKEAEALRKAQEEADRIKKEEEDKNNQEEKKSDETNQNSDNKSGYTDRERLLAGGIEILSRDNDKKDDEIRLLRSLASVGLIISSFAHEVMSLRSRLIPRTTHLLTELNNYIDEKELGHKKKDDNPFYMIRLMQEEDTRLKHWLDYSLNTLKRDKRERTNLDFEKYFDTFKATWSKALQQRNITINLFGDEKSKCVIRAFEVDMDSIFNNLLSNSMNALNGKNKELKLVDISWKKIDENIEVTFSDNGKGLDSRYEENPDEIFNFNESSKTDNKGNIIGTGLGLYIVRAIIEEYNNSNISILKIKNGLQFRITFKTKE